MITEAERNYEPRTWIETEELPEIIRPMGEAAWYYICSSDSDRFRSLVENGIGHKAVLLDYEMLSLGLDPLCGASLTETTHAKMILTVYTDKGNRTFIES